MLALFVFGCHENSPGSGHVGISIDSVATIGEQNVWPDMAQIHFADLHLIKEYMIGSNRYFPYRDPDGPFEYPRDVEIQDDRLYLLNSFNNIVVIIDLAQRTDTTIASLNNAIASFARTYGGAQQLIPRDTMLYVRFRRGLVGLDHDGRTLFDWSSSRYMRHAMDLSDGTFLAFLPDSVAHIGPSGNEIARFAYRDGHTSVLRSVGDMLYLTGIGKYVALTFDEIRQEVFKAFSPVLAGTEDSDDLYASDLTLRYTVWFPFTKRDKILLVDRINGELVSQINFVDVDFRPNERDNEWEEGVPRFDVVLGKSGIPYVVVMRDRAIKVYEVALQDK